MSQYDETTFVTPSSIVLLKFYSIWYVIYNVSSVITGKLESNLNYPRYQCPASNASVKGKG